MITNLKALTLGSSGSSDFTSLGRLIVPLGIGTPGVRLVIFRWLSCKVHRKYRFTFVAPKNKEMARAYGRCGQNFRWDSPTLDPPIWVSNERQASGELVCFCQNLPIPKSCKVHRKYSRPPIWVSNEREASGELICFCQNLPIPKSFNVKWIGAKRPNFSRR